MGGGRRGRPDRGATVHPRGARGPHRPAVGARAVRARSGVGVRPHVLPARGRRARPTGGGGAAGPAPRDAPDEGAGGARGRELARGAPAPVPPRAGARRRLPPAAQGGARRPARAGCAVARARGRRPARARRRDRLPARAGAPAPGRDGGGRPGPGRPRRCAPGRGRAPRAGDGRRATGRLPPGPGPRLLPGGPPRSGRAAARAVRGAPVDGRRRAGARGHGGLLPSRSRDTAAGGLGRLLRG